MELYAKLLSLTRLPGTAIQGLGAGGIVSMSQIILADLVPLKERGLFGAYLAM